MKRMNSGDSRRCSSRRRRRRSRSKRRSFNENKTRSWFKKIHKLPLGLLRIRGWELYGVWLLQHNSFWLLF